MTDGRARIALAAVTALLCVAVAELGCGWFVRRLEAPLLIYAPSTVTSFTLNEGAHQEHRSREFAVDYRVNAQGFRGPAVELPKPSGRSHVLVLGDSFVFGWGVREEEALPARLEGMLRAGGRDVRTVNAGFLSGCSPDDALAFLRSRGRGFEPDVVVELIYLKNDLRDLAAHRWPRVDEAGLPLRVVHPTEGPNALGGRGPVPWYHRWPVVRSSSVGQLLGRAYFVVVGLPRFVRRVEAWEAAYENENADGLSPEFESVVSGLAEECRSKSLPLVIGVIPTPQQTARRTHALYDRALQRLRELLGRERVPFLVLDAEAGVTSADLYPRDSHWRASGHEHAAAALEPLVAAALSAAAGGVAR